MANTETSKDRYLAERQDMIALKITHIKQFMNRLLAGEDFDSFLLEEASISTYNTFTIDGRQNRSFYSTEEWEDKEIRPYDFSTWKTVRPICFDLIKGRHTPAAFHFVFASESRLQDVHPAKGRVRRYAGAGESLCPEHKI